MKLQFKEQVFQLAAVASIVQLFEGQQKSDGFRYLMDTGRSEEMLLDLVQDGYRNQPITIPEEELLKRVRQQQKSQGIKPSDKLSRHIIQGKPSYHFTVEMETGTGKTYTYIRTIMELNRCYGWLKFIIVVPSIAIREGVLKSFEVMAEHFQMLYEKTPRYFVYDSSRLGDLDRFANSSDIEVMIINSQAFNSKGKDANRIHEKQESFRWRKPIDVLAATRPILIIDEPQSVEGEKTKERLKDFKPLMTLRYSATHKYKYDMVYRLDALDAYNQKLVKKIAVKTVEETTSTGTTGYLYLQELIPQKTGAPKARIEFEQKTKTGVRKVSKLVEQDFHLYEESGELEAYRGLRLTDFDASEGVNSIQIGANQRLEVGQVLGQPDEDALRRLQIRETIKTHLEKEERLYHKKIKVLSLFFIDQVAKYKVYDDQGQAQNGDYAKIFEEEYEAQVSALLADPNRHATNYWHYLNKQQEGKTAHAGYFSIDKNKKTGQTRFVESKLKKGKTDSDDQDAYDLIMKDKERLLSFEEPVRFIFSHSALKEGWDNPNVFQICTLKNTGTETEKRQKIGRGLRLAVNSQGVRQDQELLGADVHNINKLTVIANESYDSFVRNLQEELSEVIAERPQKLSENIFVGQLLKTADGQTQTIDQNLDRKIRHALVQADYLDNEGYLTDRYHNDKDSGQLKVAEELMISQDSLVGLIDTVYDGLYEIENANQAEVMLSSVLKKENFYKQEFKALWQRIRRKSVYQVAFEDEELIAKAVADIDQNLAIKKPTYQITEASAREMSQEKGLDFRVEHNGRRIEDTTQAVTTVSYDLLGEIAEQTNLKRRTIAEILRQIRSDKFKQFSYHPEAFIAQVSQRINEQKATQMVQHIEYRVLDDYFGDDLFTNNSETVRPSDKRTLEAEKAIYDYVKVDSDVEARFQKDLESYQDVRVYTKLPSSFKIKTPVGDYNPDWAIAFREGSVKHVYFVAETKGSMSSLQLKGAEEVKIACAKKQAQGLPLGYATIRITESRRCSYGCRSTSRFGADRGAVC